MTRVMYGSIGKGGGNEPGTPRIASAPGEVDMNL